MSVRRHLFLLHILTFEPAGCCVIETSGAATVTALNATQLISGGANEHINRFLIPALV